MYSFGANDTLNMCSLVRTFVHTHKSLISIFIKCNQKENDQCIHHFECARWYLLELPDFDFYHFFPTKTHGINDHFFLTLRSHCNQCFGFNRYFFFFCIKYFKWRLCRIIVTYSLSSAITQFLPHVFIGFFLHCINWNEKEKK